MAVLGGVAFSYERGTPVGALRAQIPTRRECQVKSSRRTPKICVWSPPNADPAPCPWGRVWGLGFGVEGAGCRVQGLSSGCRLSVLRYRV